MYSVTEEIYTLRNGRTFEIDQTNSNRYRLVALEADGTKTAYYFGVPIYNVHTRKILDLKFYKDEKGSRMIGSNADINIGESIRLENKNDFCNITMPEGYAHRNERCVAYNGAEIYPTTNGIACRAVCGEGGKFVFSLKTGKPFYHIRHNGKYFALMREKFKPFVTVSCIGAVDALGDIIAPAEIKYRKINDAEYELSVSSNAPDSHSVLFEINLQEEKLIQDTTVESKNPKSNNAFGGTAFVGNSVTFGEQWLYSRPDYSKLRDLFGHSVHRVTLYAPTFDKNKVLLSAYGLSNRFCSFGSNWNNKKPANNTLNVSSRINGYQKIDLTNMMVQAQRLMTRSEGWILKNVVKSSGFSVISTGDSFYAPQILEVKFK